MILGHLSLPLQFAIKDLERKRYIMCKRKFAALYCRISKNTLPQDESESIVNQKILLQKAAAQYGYEHTQFLLMMDIVELYLNVPRLSRWRMLSEQEWCALY